MKKITYVLAAAALLLLPSCRFIRLSDEAAKESMSSFTLGGKSAERVKASDNYITRNEVTGEFHSLKSNLPGDIIYTPGDCAVSIYGPDNVLDHITVHNENGFLEIKSNLYRITNLKELRVEVSSPVVEELSFNGAVALYLMAQMTTSGATGYAVEYAGRVIRDMSMEGRFTLSNLSIEMGSRAGMIAPDETTFRYLKGREYAPKGADWDMAVASWRELRSDENKVSNILEIIFG